MISRLWTAFLLSLAYASTIAWLVALIHGKNVRPVQDFVTFFKKQSKVGRLLLGTFFIAMWVIGSTKPGGGGNGGGESGGGDGGTNNIQMVINSDGGLQPLDSDHELSAAGLARWDSAAPGRSRRRSCSCHGRVDGLLTPSPRRTPRGCWTATISAVVSS